MVNYPFGAKNMKKLNFCFVFVLLLSVPVVNHGASLDWKEFIVELENKLAIDRNERTSADENLTTFQRYDLQKQSVAIAAFNIQVFGNKKYFKKDVVEVILKILKRYDLIFIQEIRDADGDSFRSLVKDLKDDTKQRWEYVLGDRLGRTSSKEQYAYLYRSDIMSLTEIFTYDDSAHDYFEREPYCAKFHIFNAAVQDIGFIGIHTKPDEAEKEVDRLVDVYDTVSEKFQTENIILMGDFNADCSYVSKSEWPSVRLRTDSRFQWLIGDGIDTTTKATHCAYDRFVVAGNDLQNAIDKSTVNIFHYNEVYGLGKDMAKEVSDHYPIQLDIVGKISDDVLEAVRVRHSIDIHSSIQVSKTELTSFAKSANPRDFDLEVSKAGRGIRSVLAVQNDVTDVPSALKGLQRLYPSLMSDVVIATAQSFVETDVLKESPKVLGYPALESDTYNIEILYRGKDRTYDVTIAKNIA